MKNPPLFAETISASTLRNLICRLESTSFERLRKAHLSGSALARWRLGSTHTSTTDAHSLVVARDVQSAWPVALAAGTVGYLLLLNPPAGRISWKLPRPEHMTLRIFGAVPVLYEVSRSNLNGLGARSTVAFVSHSLPGELIWLCFLNRQVCSKCLTVSGHARKMESQSLAQSLLAFMERTNWKPNLDNWFN